MLVSSRTFGGPADTVEQQPLSGRRRRLLHCEKLKAHALTAASQAGMSMASMALAGSTRTCCAAGYLRRSCRKLWWQPRRKLPHRRSSRCGCQSQSRCPRRYASACAAVP